MPGERKTIQEVQQAHEDELMALPNVTGVGIGKQKGNEVIKVFVTQKVPISQLKPEERIPKQVDGYETDVEEIGVISAEIE